MNRPAGGPPVKTPAEHREYVHESARLMLSFAWKWARGHREETVGGIIVRRTMIPEFSGLARGGDAGAEERLARALPLAAVERVHRLPRGRSDETFFEAAAFEILRPLLDAHLEEGYRRDLPPEDAGRRRSSLRREPAPRPPMPPNWCVFHITNALAPRSFLEDGAYLTGCFAGLMARSEAEHGCDTLYTFTWLNDCPRWLALFPEEWRRNLGPPDESVGGNLGYWGQIVTARRTFNRKTGLQIRETGRLKYRPRAAHCSFPAMRARLGIT